jgi:hypothetical protein
VLRPLRVAANQRSAPGHGRSQSGGFRVEQRHGGKSGFLQRLWYCQVQRMIARASISASDWGSRSALRMNESIKSGVLLLWNESRQWSW